MPSAAPALHPEQNHLWCALSAFERDRLLCYLEPIRFTVGKVIHEPSERLVYGYFPTSCVISLLYSMSNGSTAEVGVVGNDGVLGTSIFLRGESSCSRALVAVAGEAFRIPAKLLLHEFSHCEALQRILLSYTQALLIQVSQTAVCNCLHSLEQRLCRWLLLFQERTNCAELLMTQELLAQMLGGRRESVTVAAGKLQDAGLIHYCRGRIRILDRRGLEARACECYRVVEDEIEKLFSGKRGCHFIRSDAFEEAV